MLKLFIKQKMIRFERKYIYIYSYSVYIRDPDSNSQPSDEQLTKLSNLSLNPNSYALIHRDKQFNSSSGLS